jgi:heme exporter protein C
MERIDKIPKLFYASWWKLLSLLLLVYAIFMGFWGKIPALDILDHSIRNLYFHVPMWFSMMFLLLVNLCYSLLYLNNLNFRNDMIAQSAALVAFIFGICGLLTGSVWAKSTWGAWWVFQEVKLNGAAAGMLIYAAYFILRNAITDEQKRARVSAVYSIFAFVMYMVMINVIPRVANSSLHPGNGGNPGFNTYDLDNNLRMVFYPSVLGWLLLSCWITSIVIRIRFLERRKEMA